MKWRNERLSSSFQEYALGCASVLAMGLYPGFATAQVEEIEVIEEIVVTAQKREQSLQDVAGAVSAFGSDTLDFRSVTTIEELFQSVPGLQHSDSLGTSFLSIRGVGLQVPTGNGEPGTATHIDGVFVPRPSTGGLRSLDLERIEVLRGPQGSLYGRNATGGVVNFISRKPTEEFEAELTLGGGSFDRRKANGFVSGPITEKVLARVSAWYDEVDGQVDNILPPGFDGPSKFGDQRDFGIRAALRIVPTSNVTVDLTMSYQDQEYEPFNQILVDEFPSVLPPGLPIGANGEPYTVTASPPYHDGEKETTFVSANVTWDINDNVSLKSITGYVAHQKGPDLFIFSGPTLDVAGPAIGAPDFEWIADSENWSQEFSLTGQSFDGKLDWVVGLYYYYEDLDFQVPARLGILGVIAPGIEFLGFNRGILEETSSTAGFADATYSVTEDLRLSLGIRYTHDDKDISHTDHQLFSNSLPFDFPGFPPFLPAIPAMSTATVVACEDLESDPSEDATLPKARVEWDITEDILGYFQWTEGFKSGGGNPLICGNNFDPEDITSYEAGLKTSFLDGALVMNLSAYRYDYEGLQFTKSTALGGFIENLDEVTVAGAELELKWQAGELVAFDGTVGYTDSEIEEATDALDGRFGIDRPRTGNPVPNTPELTISAGVNLSMPTDVGEFRLRAEAYYSSEVQYRPFGNSADESDSYTLVNIYAGYTPPSERFSLQGYVRNLTDKEYLRTLSFSPSAGLTGRYGRKREWGLEATVRF